MRSTPTGRRRGGVAGVDADVHVVTGGGCVAEMRGGVAVEKRGGGVAEIRSSVAGRS